MILKRIWENGGHNLAYIPVLIFVLRERVRIGCVLPLCCFCCSQLKCWYRIWLFLPGERARYPTTLFSRSDSSYWILVSHSRQQTVDLKSKKKEKKESVLPSWSSLGRAVFLSLSACNLCLPLMVTRRALWTFRFFRDCSFTGMLSSVHYQAGTGQNWLPFRLFYVRMFFFFFIYFRFFSLYENCCIKFLNLHFEFLQVFWTLRSVGFRKKKSHIVAHWRFCCFNTIADEVCTSGLSSISSGLVTSK